MYLLFTILVFICLFFKIERLQNVHLCRAYEAQRKRISAKNAPVGGAGEKSLYHGTTGDNCDAIMKTGFNRSFAGQNGADLFVIIAGHT